MLKGCNTGGGVAILKHPRVEVPSDFFSNNIRGEVENRQVEPGGGWRCRGGGASIFSKRFISNFRSQCLVGCFSPVWEHPPTYDREPDINFMQESESEPFVKTVWRLLFSYRII